MALVPIEQEVAYYGPQVVRGLYNAAKKNPRYWARKAYEAAAKGYGMYQTGKMYYNEAKETYKSAKRNYDKIVSKYDSMYPPSSRKRLRSSQPSAPQPDVPMLLGSTGVSSHKQMSGEHVRRYKTSTDRRKKKRRFRRRRRIYKKKDEYSPTDVHREISFGQLTSNQSQKANNYSGGFGATALAARLKVHIANTTPGISTIDISQLKGAKMLYKLQTKITLRNNYNFSVKLYVWDAFAATATSKTPTTAYIEGLRESQVDGATAFTGTEPYLWPRHAKPYMSRFWILKNYKLIELAPGEEAVISYRSKTRKWVQEVWDQQAALGNTYFKGQHMFFIQQVGHMESANADVDLSPTKVDMQREFAIKSNVQYQGDFKNLSYTPHTPIIFGAQDPATQTEASANAEHSAL